MDKREIFRKAAELIEGRHEVYSCFAVYLAATGRSLERVSRHEAAQCSVYVEYGQWGGWLTGCDPRGAWMSSLPGDFEKSQKARCRVLRALAAGHRKRAEKILIQHTRGSSWFVSA